MAESPQLSLIGSLPSKGNSFVSSNIETSVESRQKIKLEAELNKLESEAEHRQLTSQENMKRKKLQQDLWSAAQAHESLMRQKARMRWIKEGRFQETMSSRPVLNGTSFQETMFFGEATMKNVKTIKLILRAFELSSGLKINYGKSSFGVLGQSEQWKLQAASYLNCRIMPLPFSYLGIPIGANPRRYGLWDPILRKTESKLSRWKQRHLSYGGRVTLIKATLTSIPIFYLFFFKIPNRRRFLWGGGLDHKKIAWVKWDCWLMEQEPLRAKYPRLYNISCQQQKLIQDMGCHFTNVWEWKLEWRRHLFYNEVQAAASFLDDISRDCWVWKPEPNGQFSTRSAYCMLLEGAADQTVDEALKDLWVGGSTSLAVLRLQSSIILNIDSQSRIPLGQPWMGSSFPPLAKGRRKAFGNEISSVDNVPSVQPAGGLLSLWNNSAFHVERRIKGHSFLFLDGRWVSEDHRLFIVNVYAPCDLVGKRILREELRQLNQIEGITSPFFDQEIKEAVWNCGGDKCLGPDGFNFNFIKAFWRVLKPEFRRFVDEIDFDGRGLGSGIKWSAIRKQTLSHKIDILCIQETKKESIDKKLCLYLWGDSSVTWECDPSCNAAGGLLCISNNDSFMVERRVVGRGFIMLEGWWIKDNKKVFIINVYAPYDLQGKRDQWERLLQLKSSYQDGLWCVLGDFNSIRHQHERLSSSQSVSNSTSITEFNSWISDMAVEEVRCIGRKFTWCRPNGGSMSKLDRFFLSDNWLSQWPDTTQFVLERDFSYHCPILLRSINIDWGPKPFKIMDWWLKDKGFQNMVALKWGNYHPHGWGGYALKQKLKFIIFVAIKGAISKIQNRASSNSVTNVNKIQNLKRDLNALEVGTHDRTLSQAEVELKKSLQEQLWFAANAYESMFWQKARVKWLKEGDINSAYFHKLINYRRRHNGIQGLIFDGVWVHDPNSKQIMEYTIINIYAPCDSQNKRVLWESIKQLKILNPNGLWCLVGDFNSVRNASERVGISQRGMANTPSNEFNEWLEDLDVVEPPCIGKKYTWFRPNGTARSNSQFVLERNFSDHCPVLFKSKNVDWGAKPFKVLDFWLKDKSFGKIVKECWTQTQLSGWGASSPSFLSKAHLGGEAPSSMAYSLMHGASSHLLSFVFHCISMDPIEAQRSSLHRSPTSKLPSSGNQSTRASSSHNSCKNLSEELRDYYKGRHSSHLRPHSHRRENEKKPQETNINLPYFHGKDNELLDEGLVRKSLNPCALLVPKICIIRHQIPKISGMMNVLSGATLFCKITRAPNIFMICVHRDSLGSFNTNLGTHMGHLRFVILFGRNNQHENTEKRFVPYFSILVTPLIVLVRNHVPSWEDAQEMDFQTLPYFNIPNTTNIYCGGKKPRVSRILGFEVKSFSRGEGMMQSYPARALDRLQVDWARDAREGPRVLMSLRVDFGLMG
ncbi:hypothetical protein HKD37_19G053302 [Glycine soja]